MMRLAMIPRSWEIADVFFSKHVYQWAIDGCGAGICRKNDSWLKDVRCNPDVAPRLNSDKLMILPQSTYLPEKVPDFHPSLR